MNNLEVLGYHSHHLGILPYPSRDGGTADISRDNAVPSRGTEVPSTYNTAHSQTFDSKEETLPLPRGTPPSNSGYYSYTRRYRYYCILL